MANAAAAPRVAAKPPAAGPEPFTLVIFGASGDLTRRKLVPAIFDLWTQRLLPPAFSVVGFARREKSDAAFRDELYEGVRAFARSRPVARDTWNDFARNVYYHRADYDDPAGYRAFRDKLSGWSPDKKAGCNLLFYLATPPEAVPTIVDQLERADLARSKAEACPWSRVIVEKPFGTDLGSARELNRRILASFDESQVYRIDHYLGKETVQNLLVLRFANAIFEPIWNQKYVDHVQITVSETVGVEGRGSYYEAAGALRDMVQNHMMHLLSLVAMEAPVSLAADAVRDEKVKVLKALRPIPPECAAQGVARAQYAPGRIDGEPARGYHEEPGVAADSGTETFVALTAHVDNWRWAGVPFYLRTGKRMPARITDISIHFKEVPRVLFGAPPLGPMQHNVLAIRIQPNEGIALRFQVKEPGPAMKVRPFRMDFGYATAFNHGPPEAYERLLLDAVLEDATLFTRADEVEAAWAFLSPILEGCPQRGAGPLPTYAAGTWGPTEADELIERNGRRWSILRRRAVRGSG